jgi:hypothetical protein
MRQSFGPRKIASNLSYSVQQHLNMYAIAAAMQLARSSPRPR